MSKRKSKAKHSDHNLPSEQISWEMARQIAQREFEADVARVYNTLLVRIARLEAESHLRPDGFNEWVFDYESLCQQHGRQVMHAVSVLLHDKSAARFQRPPGPDSLEVWYLSAPKEGKSGEEAVEEGNILGQ